MEERIVTDLLISVISDFIVIKENVMYEGKTNHIL